MKIAFWHFYTFRMRRGVETLTVSLSNALAKKGIDVSIISASPRVDVAIKPDPTVRIFSFPTFRYFEHYSIVPFYMNHFRKHSYDYVVTFFSDFGEGLTYQLLGSAQRPPLIIYLCYSYSGAKHRFHSFLKYGWDKKAQQVLADAKWIAEESEPVLKRPIAVLPVGVDPEKFSYDPVQRRELRKKFGYSEQDIVLLNVSALEECKGVWRVIEAMGRLKEKMPQLKYHILGKGNHEQELKKRTQVKGLEDRICFSGESSSIAEFYNMADIFIMLPDAEANSLASIEAMSSGLPLIVSNNGGFLESVPAEAGVFVDIENFAEIDKAIIQLATQGDLRLAMGRIARETAIRRFSWDQIAEQFLSKLQ